MEREQAEKLLGAMIFDDLDAPSRAELLAYLETDDDLRQRLADLRMSAKVTTDALQHEPVPVLSQERLEKLQRLAQGPAVRRRIITLRRCASVAAVLVVGVLTSSLFLNARRIRSHLGQDSKSMDSYEQFGMNPVASEELTGGTQVALDTPEALGISFQRQIAEDGRRLAEGRRGGSLYDVEAPAPKGQANKRRPDGDTYAYYVPDSSARMGRGMGGGMGGMGGMSDDMGGGMGGGMMGGMAQDEHGRSNVDLGDLAPPKIEEQVALNFKANGVIPPLLPDSTDPEQEVRFGQPSKVQEEREDRYARARASSRRAAPFGPRDRARGGGEARPEIVIDALSAVPQSGRGTVAGNIHPTKPTEAEPQSLARGNSGAAPASMPALTTVWRESDGVEPAEVAVAQSEEGTPDTQSELSEIATLGKQLAAAKEPEPQIRDNKDTDLGYSKRPVRQSVTASENKNDTTDFSLVANQPLEEGLQRSKSFFWGVDKEQGAKADALALAPATPTGGLGTDTSAGLAFASSRPDDTELPPAARFKTLPVNPWVMTEKDSQSTFGLDVDTASYAICRRYIRGGYRPPVGAVRMEEFINAFDYDYPQQSERTFAVHAQAGPSPLARDGEKLTLLQIGVKARTLGRDQQKPAHLVFVVDASASMGQSDRLPLIQHGLNLLVGQLNETDRVSLITCAAEAHLHLDAVPAQERERISAGIQAIQSTGSTHLVSGLKLGYATARRYYQANTVNQVILCSDGVANIGPTESEAILNEVSADRKQGIYLTTVGVGYGAYNDSLLEGLANRGDGRYVFLDSPAQAERLFVDQFAATLHTVAQDARIQVSFDPQRVRRYRLIGYENRDIADRDFRNDAIDAGEVGSGQCSTALYELELIDTDSPEPLQPLGTVSVRYRNTDTGRMEEIARDLKESLIRPRTPVRDPRFCLAAGVAGFAEWLRESEHAQALDLARIREMVKQVQQTLPLDRDIRELAALMQGIEHLPKAP